MSSGSDQSERQATPPAPQYSGFLTVFPSIMLPMFMAIVDQTIVATALPAIAASTGEVERASWIVVGYLIAATIAAPLYGRLGDAFGRRKLMFVAIAVFMVASLGCAVAPTIEWLTLARVVQGLGGGGLMTLSQALIGEAIPPRERARYQGYVATVAVTANSFGPVAGGYLTEHFGWESIFLINIPISLVAFALVVRLPRVSPQGHKWRADPFGLVLFAVTVAALLLALEQAQAVDLQALPSVLSLLVLAMIALALLVRQENRVPSPLIPLGLLRMPAIWRSDAMAACHGATLVSLITFLPVYLIVVRGQSPSETGLLLVPLTIGVGAGSMIIGRLVSRTGHTLRYSTFGLGVQVVSLMALVLWAPTLGAAPFAALLLWTGLFLGTVMGVVQVTVQQVSGPARLGEAAASVQFSRSMGAAFGTALVAFTLFAVLSLKNPESAHAFAHLVERGGDAQAVLTGPHAAAIRADITAAFRAAFMLITVFAACNFLLAFSHPVRRI